MAEKKTTKPEEGASAAEPLPPSKSDDTAVAVGKAKTERELALAERDEAREKLQLANKNIERLERENRDLRAMVYKLEAGAPAELPENTAYIVESVKFQRIDTGEEVGGGSGDIVVLAEKGSKAEATALQAKFGSKHRVFPVSRDLLEELLNKHLARRGR